MKICAPHGAHHVRPCTRLTEFINVYSLPLASAKSEARIGLRQIFKVHNRLKRFFCVIVPHTCRFMAGLLGASSDAPVSLKTGKTNPDNPATIPDIGLSLGGSILQGACPMRTYTLAVLAGDGRYFSTSYVHHFCQLSACSLSEANDIAARIGAVVIAWRVA